MYCFNISLGTRFIYRGSSRNIQRKLTCFGTPHRKVKGNPRTHMLHWEAILMVMRKPAWGLALTVTISQHVLAKMILHHARVLGQHLVEVGSVVKKLVPWSPHSLMDYIYSSGNGSQRNHTVGSLGSVASLCNFHNTPVILFFECNSHHCIQSPLHRLWAAFLGSEGRLATL